MPSSPWKDPPLTRTPLDYVPIDAPVSNPGKPTVFKAPTLRRAAIAGAVAAVAVGVGVFAPVVALSAIGIAFVSGCVWGTNKLIEAIDTHGQ